MKAIQASKPFLAVELVKALCNSSNTHIHPWVKDLHMTETLPQEQLIDGDINWQNFPQTIIKLGKRLNSHFLISFLHFPHSFLFVHLGLDKRDLESASERRGRYASVSREN